MYENTAKAQFVCYLMGNKHNQLQAKAPFLKNLSVKNNLPLFFNEYNSEFTENELFQWLKKLSDFLKEENEISEAKKDLIFGFLYSCAIFTKLVKKKEFEFQDIAVFYKKLFEENKKYMCEFNKKDQGKININAPKEIVCRFPPEASGFLHIGHVKAALLNNYMAREGKLILRFDDTNPVKEEKRYEDAILEDMKLLKINNYKITRTSDHFEKIFECAIFLIEKNLAYVDNTPQEHMRKERMDGIASACRNTPVSENLRIFKEMNEGKHQDYCLRAKIDYTALNKALRDPVIYRYVGQEHAITGNKYQIYPTYDFACPIVDSLDGVTLALRTNEYRDRNPQYEWFLEHLKLRKVKIYDFSRLNFENTVLSKRKIKFYVDNNLVDGWDDPRVATLRGIKRLGLNMDVLCEYILKQGSSQKSSTISWDKIWAANKKFIDNLSPRFFAVRKKNVVECEIENFDFNEKFEEVLKMSKNTNLGYKLLCKSKKIFLDQEDAVLLSKGDEITLMSWGNMIVLDLIVKEGKMCKIIFKENPSGCFKTTKHKLTWVSGVNFTEFKVFEYGNLQNNKDTDDLREKFNHDSMKQEIWYGESEIAKLQKNETIQIVRQGFYICDKPSEFILIPYTKQKRENKI